MTKTRMEAFSDGVIAIIITIMVLELRPPHETTWAAIRPSILIFFSYMMSFIVLGIYWGNHHHLLHAVKEVNSRMMWANLHLLFWLSLIPFATAWMQELYFKPVTVAVYAGVLDLCGIAYYFLLKTVENSLPHHEKLYAPLHKQTRKGMLSTLIYTLAIPAAFIHPIVSGILFVSVTLLWWIPDKNIEQTMRLNDR